MEMDSAQWLSELGIEYLDIEGQCNADLSESAEQLKESVGNQNNFVYESDMSFTGYPRNVKLPVTVSQLVQRPSGRYSGDERPAKQSKPNILWASPFHGQQRLSSKVCASPSIYVPNSQQKLQHQLGDKYFTDFFKLNGDEAYENVDMTTPSIQAEIVASGGHDQSCTSDTIYHSHVDAFTLSSGKFLGTNHGPLERISSSISAKGHSNVKTSGHSQDHSIAERKRREKLSQRFIALSAIIPGLKKMDKATVLGDAIKYVKQLEDRIKALEEQIPKLSVQSVVYVKKVELCSDDHEDSNKVSSSFIDSSSDKAVIRGIMKPEIEARLVAKNVLIHIHCEKKKNLLVEVLAELERLQLTVLNASILSFSESSFDLTFNAKMEEKCDLTGKVIAKALQALFNKTT
eukprot:PITA_06236